jgi:hypothetical protein
LLSIAEQAGIGQHGSAIAKVAANRPLIEDTMTRKRWIVAAGKADKARAYYTQIVTLTREMDSERPEIQRAKSFLGSR